MTSRTCQLCGKALGRIRVGSGGDFCSKEHRNQYRLRKSMDCLTEASKVSALARRRENPKPVFGNAAPAPADATPRGSLEAAPFDLGATAREQALQLSLAEIAGRVGIQAAVRFPEGKPAPPNGHTEPPAPSPRSFGMSLMQGGSPLTPVARPISWKPSPVGGAKDQRVQNAAPSPSVGNAVRVSASAWFQPKAAPALDRLTTGPHRKSSLAPLTGLPKEVAAVRPPAAAERRRAEVERTMEVGCPDSPAGRFAAAMPTRTASQIIEIKARGGTGRGSARLGYTDMGFTTAQESAARVDWVEATPEPCSGQEIA